MPAVSSSVAARGFFDVPGPLAVPWADAVKVGAFSVEDFANRPLGQQRLDVLEQADPAQLEANTGADTGGFDGGDHLAEAAEVKGKRLFDHQMLARLGRRDGFGRVIGMRRANADDIDTRMFQECGQIVKGSTVGQAMGLSFGLSLGFIARTDGDH